MLSAVPEISSNHILVQPGRVPSMSSNGVLHALQELLHVMFLFLSFSLRSTCCEDARDRG